ncbi:MAG: hypothetical protein M0P74_10515 [Syntrophales bacterium]|jgi:hypothetical protein|nr:hypothetical protein [Syntrophales bacterium]
MNPSTLTFAEMAETITPETLPDFLHRLSSRPEPHDLNFTALILELAGETLNRTPFSIFRQYADLTGERNPELAERLWKISFPGVLINLKPKEPKTGIVIDFPIDRLKKSMISTNYTR